MRDPHTGDSRGFGFVTFEDNGDAEAAMTSLNATDLLGRVINVAKARRARARTPTPGQYHGSVRSPSTLTRPSPPKPDERRGYGRDGPPRGGYCSSGPFAPLTAADDDRGPPPRRYDDRRDYCASVVASARLIRRRRSSLVPSAPTRLYARPVALPDAHRRRPPRRRLCAFRSSLLAHARRR